MGRVRQPSGSEGNNLLCAGTWILCQHSNLFVDAYEMCVRAYSP